MLTQKQPTLGSVHGDLALLTLIPLLLLASQSLTWRPDLLADTARWTERMNDARIQAEPPGMRIRIGPGKTWAIAALPNVRMPADVVDRLHIRVASLSPNARWLLRLYGPLSGSRQAITVGLFEGTRTSGDHTLILDRRLLPVGRQPVQLQLGLEGGEGDSVVFERLEFHAAPTRKAAYVPRGQVRVTAVDMMPDMPRPFNVPDWRTIARKYDRLAFNLEASGPHLPLIWLDNSRVNIPRTGFGISSYVGDGRLGGSSHESITSLGAVLGATLVGIDKSRQQHDWVSMCAQYYDIANGQRLVLNGINHMAGGSFWYDIFPHIVFYAISDRYPRNEELDSILRSTAARWLEAVSRLRNPAGLPDFNHTGFNFAKMEAQDNGRWREPDAAAGVAWLQLAAWKRTGDRKHLDAAWDCLRWLTSLPENPYYEVLLPWGAVAAARLNAEAGASLDVEKLVQWCFGLSACRVGWSVITSRWGAYDCHGLLGSIENRGGYAFAMNTFAQAGALIPLVRYDTRFAYAIGKWMLNAANAARLFYPHSLPGDHQCCADWKGDPEGVIAYEGLRQLVNGRSPYATGDPVEMNWGPKTDLGLYGSSYVGMLGSIVHKTNVPGILALDCLATDFFREPALPTYLLYNPYTMEKVVSVPGAGKNTDMYDAVTNRVVSRGESRVRLAPQSAAVIVLLPRGAKPVRSGGHIRAGGIVIRWQLPKT